MGHDDQSLILPTLFLSKAQLPIDVPEAKIAIEGPPPSAEIVVGGQGSGGIETSWPVHAFVQLSTSRSTRWA
jgi:hypothetical protein